MFKQAISDKANKILSDRHKESMYLDSCLSANICPCCGSKVQREHYDEGTIGFFIFKRPVASVSKYTCINDKCSWERIKTSHYNYGMP